MKQTLKQHNVSSIGAVSRSYLRPATGKAWCPHAKPLCHTQTNRLLVLLILGELALGSFLSDHRLGPPHHSLPNQAYQIKPTRKCHDQIPPASRTHCCDVAREVESYKPLAKVTAMETR